MDDVRGQFEREMHALYQNAVEQCDGYRPTLFQQEVRKRGGLAAARHFLSTGDDAQTGLYRLADCGKLNLSMECLVIRHHALFEPEEVETARNRLFEAASARPELYPDITAICRP